MVGKRQNQLVIATGRKQQHFRLASVVLISRLAITN